MKPFRHVLSINDFSREDLEEIARQTVALHDGKKKIIKSRRREKATLAILEPSTRTISSFHEACLRLGWDYFQPPTAEMTSLKKGEPLWRFAKNLFDTFTTTLVLRTHIEGAQRFIARRAEQLGYDISVINAGDGRQEHPTQAMQFAATVLKRVGRLTGFPYGFFGDLKYGRVAHSEAILINKFGGELYTASDEQSSLPDYFVRMFGNRFHAGDKLEFLKPCRVNVGFRVQFERFGNDVVALQRAQGKFRVTGENIGMFPEDVIFCHPQPFNTEFSDDLETDPRLALSLEVRMGVFNRTFLLHETRKNRNLANFDHIHKNSIEVGKPQMSVADYLKDRREKGKKETLYSLITDEGVIVDRIQAGLGIVFRNFLIKNGVIGDVGTTGLFEKCRPTRMGEKDILILHDQHIPEKLMLAMSALCPTITFNDVRSGKYIQYKVKASPIAVGFGKCGNPACITNNSDGGCATEFINEANALRCCYCGISFPHREVLI
ncbi:MAG: hypothetical protein PHE24_05235 [Patescibacteria group bacterium]|nr:hypothetical protein [Patescibacteria group bacterium]